MTEALGDAMQPALVQAMVAPGVDLAIGIHQHPSVGGVLVVGPRGADSDTSREVALRVLPLTDLDVERRLESEPVRGWLARSRGPVDRSALTDVLSRLARLADDLPEVAELRANPLIVSDQGAAITDVFVRIAPWRRDDTPDLRRL